LNTENEEEETAHEAYGHSFLSSLAAGSNTAGIAAWSRALLGAGEKGPRPNRRGLANQ